MVTMAGDTDAARSDLDPHSRDVELVFNRRDTTTNNVEKNTVTNAELDDDANALSGGLKAWLNVLATFFMFISAWYAPPL